MTPRICPHCFAPMTREQIGPQSRHVSMCWPCNTVVPGDVPTPSPSELVEHSKETR